jgi:ABC-type transporter Mla MlaB component
MLKIRRSAASDEVIFALSGRIEKQHVSELLDLLQGENEGTQVALDLEEVKLVDREAVRFLAACEARGIRLQNPPPYIRKWIDTGSDKGHEE